MTAFVLVAALIVVASCQPSTVKSELSGSDSLVIRFASGRTVATTEAKAIRRLVRFVDGGSCDTSPCRTDGVMQFFEKEMRRQSVSFSYRDETCRCFQMHAGGEVLRTHLSREAADFLSSLEAGRNWY